MPDLSPISIRPAHGGDQAAIEALVRSERLNPNDLPWHRFRVAVDSASAVVGAVQIRAHADGAQELGSLVVRPEYRGRGVARRLTEAALAARHASVYTVTSRQLEGFFGRWWFERADLRSVPGSIRRNYLIGRIGGSLLAWARLRRPKPLLILRRG